MTSKGKLVGFSSAPTQTHGSYERTQLPLPPATNFETLVGEARLHGFEVACLGHVVLADLSQLIVALRGPAAWEVFVGAHHRLERVAVEPQTSFDFGDGVFLTGRNLQGEQVHLLVPRPGIRDNLGLTPTYNGEPIRRF